MKFIKNKQQLINLNFRQTSTVIQDQFGAYWIVKDFLIFTCIWLVFSFFPLSLSISFSFFISFSFSLFLFPSLNIFTEARNDLDV